MASTEAPLEITQGSTLHLPIRLVDGEGNLLTYEGTELRAQLRQRTGGGRVQLAFSTEDDTITYADETLYTLTDEAGNVLTDEDDEPIQKAASIVLHATASATAAISIERGVLDVEAVHGADDVEKIVPLRQVKIIREATR